MDTFLYGGKLVEGHKAVIRSDTGEALGVVSPRYKPIQIRDQWAGLDPLIDAGLASIETLGSIKNGRYIWGMVKFNSDEIPEWDELQELVGEIQPYGLVYDVKDGSGAAVLANTNVRVVCNNTLEAARAGLTNCIKIKHVGDTAAKVREAADDMWGGIIEGLNMLRVRYMTLDNIHLMNSEFDDLVLNPISPIPTDPNLFKTEARFDTAVDRAKARREEVRRLWFEGKGHTGRSTAWEALNGAIEALDHNEAGLFRKSRNNQQIASMINGTNAKLKQTITNNLLTLAA